MNKTVSINNTISKVVCWKCGKGGGKGDAPLRKVSNTNYVCLNDLHWGKPEMENLSEIPYQKKEKTAHDKHNPTV